ncbi:MAG: hypothetical protein ABIR17_09875 [Pseudolysinimonas sp.]
MNERSSVRNTPIEPAKSVETSDWLAELASSLDLVTRVTTRLRPDGLIEVVVSGLVVGYVEHVAPIFVALAGDRPGVAIEVAQRRTLRAAVDALRSHSDGRA